MNTSAWRKNNQRELYKKYTGKDPLGEIHHGLPEEFHKWFNEHGIKDINSGKYYFDLSKGRHRLKKCYGIHTKNSPLGKPWNKVWDEWIGANPNATANQILQQLEKMAKEAGIDGYRAIPKK